MTKRTWVLIIGGLLLGALILRQFLALPSLESVPGEFQQTAYIRNENNRGNKIQYYAFSVKDTSNAEFIALGNLLPHHQNGGMTIVFFFYQERAPTILTLDSPHFDSKTYKPIATYKRVGKQNAELTIHQIANHRDFN